MKKFAAVLLAGGRSMRMRTNKALLDYNGLPMWHSQMDKLVTLRPSELFFSTQPEMEFPQGPWTFVHDRSPDLGPLGGLEAALQQTRSDFLVTLAVDMPRMTAGFLNDLLSESQGAGTAPLVDGFYCGGAAVYPTRILPLVQKVLASNDRSFQHLISQAIQSGMMNAREVLAAQRILFENWNSPDDLARSQPVTPR